jgi:hypothetical protein
MSKTVQMTVTVTVEPPEGIEITKDRAIELAMSAVTQFHEVDCGPPGRIKWAKVYAEVSDNDCEVVE